MPSTRRLQILLGLAVVAVAIGLFFVVRTMSGGDAEPSASPSPSEPSPEPSPSATPTPVAQPRPFTVKIAGARGVPTDSGNLYARKSQARNGVVRDAAAQAGKALERYLTAVFVDKATRFETKPLRALLTVPAYKSLRKTDRAALGVGSLDVVGGGKGRAKAWAVVLHRDKHAFSVTLKYRATIPLVVGTQEAKPKPLVQQGTMVFAPTKGPWRADMADVRLSLPPEPSVDKQPEPLPSKEATS